jgi:SAM-dependent methyltransferase
MGNANRIDLFINALHNRLIFDRRARILAARLAPLFPPNAEIIDIGCGDGTIGQHILDRRPDISITGIDLFFRPSPKIPVVVFDGTGIPYADDSFDVAMLVDVLHHTDDPTILLSQAKRVARKAIIIKDHFSDGFLAKATLRIMDWVGNVTHGVRLPYNYLTRKEWAATFQSLALTPDESIFRLGLYPMPGSLIFDRGLHFVTRIPIERSVV